MYTYESVKSYITRAEMTGSRAGGCSTKRVQATQEGKQRRVKEWEAGSGYGTGEGRVKK